MSISTFNDPSEAGDVDLLLIAGEHSGDQHGAALIQALHARYPDLKIAAIAGPASQKTDADFVFNFVSFATLGFWDVFKRYPKFKSIFKKTLEWIQAHKPKHICTVDYPGFNLRLAKALHRSGISSKGGGSTRLHHYISPQIWAWKAQRRFFMETYFDSLACILPFEISIYKDTNLPVFFVGHPYLDPSNQVKPPLRYDPKGPVLLCPGSREAPVKRILPIMLDTVSMLRRDKSDLEVLIPYPDSRIRALIESILDQKKSQVAVDAVHLCPDGANLSASAVLNSAGTMSLRCALAGIPGALVYRIDWASYFLAKSLIKVPYLGIPNLVLEKVFYKEYIQSRAKPVLLYEEVRPCYASDAAAKEAEILSQRLRQCLKAPEGSSPSDWMINQMSIQNQ